jgi:amino acid permease
MGLLIELVNIGTLFAFVIVCISVMVLRRTQPDRPRPFKVPLYPVTPILGVLCCIVLMLSLPWMNWVRLLIWMVIGLVIYWFYGRKNSKLRTLEVATRASEEGATASESQFSSLLPNQEPASASDETAATSEEHDQSTNHTTNDGATDGVVKRMQAAVDK